MITSRQIRTMNLHISNAQSLYVWSGGVLEIMASMSVIRDITIKRTYRGNAIEYPICVVYVLHCITQVTYYIHKYIYNAYTVVFVCGGREGGFRESPGKGGFAKPTDDLNWVEVGDMKDLVRTFTNQAYIVSYNTNQAYIVSYSICRAISITVTGWG
jgi:hypothetical protein